VASVRLQRIVDAPLDTVWELVSDPNLHPHWWSTVVESECDEIAEGCRFRAVVKGPFGRTEEHEFTIVDLDECRLVTIRCEEVGVYNRFGVTEARGQTFVDGEFGVDPQTLGVRLFGMTPLGRRYLRRWLEESLEALGAAAASRGAGGRGIP
jgi:polyketide cyclase/dehydrase/lipid transport protein